MIVMRTPSAIELFDAWERGLQARPVERGLELLSLARPDLAHDALADLSIGERDAALLALREAVVGGRMTALARCPSCGEALELDVTTADLRAGASSETLALQHDGYDVALRLLTSRDLAVAAAAEPDQRRRVLLERCVVSASHDGENTG